MSSLATLDAIPPASPDESIKALAYATQTSRALSTMVQHYAKDADVLSNAHRVVAQLQDDMKGLVADIEYKLLQCVGKKRSITLTTGVKVEKFSDPKEVWDSDLVREALAGILAQHAIETETGEVTLNTEHAGRIVDVILAVMSKSNPKKQALKAHRINPDTLTRMEWGADKVRIIELSHPDDKMVTGGAK